MPNGPWSKLADNALQARQDHRAARLRARLGGVTRRPVRRRSEKRRHRQLRRDPRLSVGRARRRPPIRSRSRGSPRSAACARASRRPAFRRNASRRRPAAASGEGPLSYWGALAPYFKALGDERGLGLARTHLAALDAPRRQAPGREPVYYDRVLGLFGTGFIDGRYRFDEAGRLVPSWRSAC